MPSRRRATRPACAAASARPAQVREYLRRFEEAGVDQVIFVLQAGRNRHEHIMESIELLGREVLPEFAERDEAQVAAKAARLAPAIEAAMARRAEAYEPVDIGDYAFPALPRQWATATHDDALAATLDRWADDRAAGVAPEPIAQLGGE